MTTRRGWRGDAVYFDHTGPCTDPARHRNCPGRWRGAISLGFGPDGKRIRRKVSGTTRAAEVTGIDVGNGRVTGVRTSKGNIATGLVSDRLAQGNAPHGGKQPIDLAGALPNTYRRRPRRC